MYLQREEYVCVGSIWSTVEPRLCLMWGILSRNNVIRSFSEDSLMCPQRAAEWTTSLMDCSCQSLSHALHFKVTFIYSANRKLAHFKIQKWLVPLRVGSVYGTRVSPEEPAAAACCGCWSELGSNEQTWSILKRHRNKPQSDTYSGVYIKAVWLNVLLV